MGHAGKWGYTRDGENYYGDYDTPEEAAEGGATEEGETVTVGIFRDPIAPEQCIDGEHLIEQVLCQDDYCNDWADCTLDCTKQQLDELTKEIQGVFGKWIDRHGLRPAFGLVEETREITV